jgi:hypothetical protein
LIAMLWSTQPYVNMVGRKRLGDRGVNHPGTSRFCLHIYQEVQAGARFSPDNNSSNVYV